jgi:hypothetical protein
MERETPITTDLTGGKKADMKRPTKPVMWTDKEATNRINGWLESKEFIIHASSEIDGHESFSVSYKDVVMLTYCSGLETIKDELGYLLNGLSITTDSLLHDLNIIKPIGRLEYTSEWIDKILAGTKTMSIRKTQYQCGYYELWDTERQKVRGIVEVVMVSKQIFSYECERIDISGRVVPDDINPVQFSIKNGFDSFAELLDYHRNNFQSIKYAITYRMVDMKGDGE